MKIVVIGGGSVGAQVAHRLSHEGAQVTLIEAGALAHGTSRTSFAWLSSFPQRGWPEEQGRAALRATVDNAFDRVEEELGQRFVSWTGCVTVADGADIELLRANAEVCASKGVDVRELRADEVADVEPELRIGDDEAAFFETMSGWVDVEGMVAAIADSLVDRGHRVLVGARVIGIDVEGDRAVAVRTDRGDVIAADVVVNAAGSWGTHVAAMAGLTIPVDLVPGRIAYTPRLPDDFTLSRIVNTPLWGARPHAGGGLAINARGALPKGGNKGHGPNLRSEADMVASLRRYLPNLPGLDGLTSRVGVRPIPPDGPIIGTLPWLPNVYTTISHGGIGWAPTWGNIAAREILHGESVPEVAAMRPMRFHRGVEELGKFADDAEQIST